MIYKQENDIVEVYFPFKGEEFEIGHIKDDVTKYIFVDTLFAYSDTITNKDLEHLKLEIEKYYSQRDSIGRIESKYPHYFP